VAVLRKKLAFAALLKAAFKAYTREKALGIRKESWKYWLKTATGCNLQGQKLFSQTPTD